MIVSARFQVSGLHAFASRILFILLLIILLITQHAASVVGLGYGRTQILHPDATDRRALESAGSRTYRSLGYVV
jgi:hypothetical protein